MLQSLAVIMKGPVNRSKEINWIHSALCKKKNVGDVAVKQTCRSSVADRLDLVFHSSRWQCQQARMVPEGYAME